MSNCLEKSCVAPPPPAVPSRGQQEAFVLCVQRNSSAIGKYTGEGAGATSEKWRKFDFFWSVFDIKGAETKEGSALEIIEAYDRAKAEL